MLVTQGHVIELSQRSQIVSNGSVTVGGSSVLGTSLTFTKTLTGVSHSFVIATVVSIAVTPRSNATVSVSLKDIVHTYEVMLPTNFLDGASPLVIVGDTITLPFNKLGKVVL